MNPAQGFWHKSLWSTRFKIKPSILVNMIRNHAGILAWFQIWFSNSLFIPVYLIQHMMRFYAHTLRNKSKLDWDFSAFKIIYMIVKTVTPCFIRHSFLCRSLVRYRIVENFGSGKHWRIWQIKQWFAKVLPSKFYQCFWGRAIIGACDSYFRRFVKVFSANANF